MFYCFNLYNFIKILLFDTLGEQASDIVHGAQQNEVVYGVYKETVLLLTLVLSSETYLNFHCCSLKVGLDDEKTLNAAFEYYSFLIQLYALTNCINIFGIRIFILLLFLNCFLFLDTS